MTTLALILTRRPHDAIIINEDKQQSAMSEVDLKSKVGCFLPKSPQVVLGTSRRLEGDLGSLLYQVGSDWHTKVTPRATYHLFNLYTHCPSLYLGLFPVTTQIKFSKSVMYLTAARLLIDLTLPSFIIYHHYQSPTIIYLSLFCPTPL